MPELTGDFGQGPQDEGIFQDFRARKFQVVLVQQQIIVQQEIQIQGPGAELAARPLAPVLVLDAMQHPGAELGLVFNMGGSGVANYASILEGVKG